MAEEQVTSQTLVLPNEHEKMLGKLRNMQLNNLTAKKQNELAVKKKRFFYEFKELSYSFFSLSESQLKEFNAGELIALDKLISHKARPWAICQILFTFGVPIFGWAFGPMLLNVRELNCWQYLRYRKYFRKIYGEKFSSEMFKDKLQPKP